MAQFHIGHGVVSIGESSGTPQVPASWSALTDVGEIDPDAGSVMNFNENQAEIRPSGKLGPTKVYNYGGEIELVLSILNTELNNLAKAMGLKTTDIIDDAVNTQKLIPIPKAAGYINEFHVQVKQLQMTGTGLYSYLRIPRAYLVNREGIEMNESKPMMLKLTFKGMAVTETITNWTGKSAQIALDYTVE